jgi:hypothetical protein
MRVDGNNFEITDCIIVCSTTVDTVQHKELYVLYSAYYLETTNVRSFNAGHFSGCDSNRTQHLFIEE